MNRFATYNASATATAKAGAIGIVLCMLLSACGSTSNGTGAGGGISGQTGSAPVSLVKSFNAQSSIIQKIALNAGAVAKAVDRYRINKRAEPSPYQKIGIDLNGDSQAEALVYLTGDSWCTKTGCTLVIFRNGQFGYRAISTIRRVKAPVRIAVTENQGWRDVIVQTGGVSGLPEQTVALRFTGRGYPGNATTIAPIDPNVPVEGVVVFERQPDPVQPIGDGLAPANAPIMPGAANVSQPVALQP